MRTAARTILTRTMPACPCSDIFLRVYFCFD